MPMRFDIASGTDRGICERIRALEPTNPFYTAAYVEAQQRLGLEPWILMVREDDQILSACTAFSRSGRLNRLLDVPSLPALQAPDVFWPGLLGFCRRAGVTHLQIGSFASRHASIPFLPGETKRRQRTEFLLDLHQSDPWSSISQNHVRNIRKARKAGIELRRSHDPKACQGHIQLMRSSLHRRTERGESVSGEPDLANCLALIETKAGEIFQAVCGETLLSSILVLRAEKGAYYQSAGSSAEGMASGASHFLIRETAQVLADEGVEVFVLGGASEPGLARYKAGFGAQAVELESAEVYVGPAWKRKLTTALRLIRENPRNLWRAIVQVENYVAYVADPTDITAEEEGQLALEKLSDDKLSRLAGEHGDLVEHSNRTRRYGFNDAYAVFIDGRLAHVSWMIPASHDRLLPVRNVKLHDHEAEITNCLTIPEFRGQGVYPRTIRRLCELAVNLDIHQVWMITGTANKASQRGIQKAGFVRRGRIIRFSSPLLPQKISLTYRGHRRWMGE